MSVIKHGLKKLLFNFLTFICYLKPIVYKKNNKKIFIIGDIYSVSGLGNTLRSLIQSLDGKFEFSLINLPLSIQSEQKFMDLKKYEVSSIESGINIFVGSPSMLARALLRRDFFYVITNYSIGIWFWELPSIPKEWFGINKLINEVWVQSEFSKKIFEQKSKVTKLMPFAVNEKKNDFYDRSYFSIPENVFIFTFAFDYLSRIERKNPSSAILAFQEEFGDDSSVMLIIKTINRSKVFDEDDYIQSMIQKSKNIMLIDRYYSDDEISGLISISDCFISLHRAEGLGLAMAEAMSLGTLVIATDYSGNTTFMNQGNSLLVKYELVPVKKGSYSHYKNNFWAEPSLKDARKKMRFAFECREETRHLVEQAIKDIEKFSHKHQGDWIKNQLVGEFEKSNYESSH